MSRQAIVTLLSVILFVIIAVLFVAGNVAKQKDQYNQNVQCMKQAILDGRDPQTACQ